jgi:hypothetical protein
MSAMAVKGVGQFAKYKNKLNKNSSLGSALFLKRKTGLNWPRFFWRLVLAYKRTPSLETGLT